MTLKTVDLTPRIGTEVATDVATLLSGSIAGELRVLLEQRELLFRDMDIDDEQLIAFGETLGEVRHDHGTTIMKVTVDRKANPQHADYFHATKFWHIDGTHDQVPPLASILSPRVLSPAGGETEFANTYAAYDDLSDAEKAEFEKIRILHNKVVPQLKIYPNPTEEQMRYWQSFAPKIHPLVWRHASGRKSLFTSVSSAEVVGMEKAESDAFLARILDWITQARFVYRHIWRMGDLLMWDNTGTMHRVLPYDLDSGRRLHRVTLDGEEAVAKAA